MIGQKRRSDLPSPGLTARGWRRIPTGRTGVTQRRMDSFLITPASSRLTLEEVVGRLDAQSAVRAVLLLGSAAGGEFGPGSDYDLFLILAEADGFRVEVSFIDGRIADVLIASEDLVRQLLATPPDDIDAEGWRILRWLATSRPVIDHAGLGDTARTCASDLLKAKPAPDEWTLREARWSLTYDVRVNKKCLDAPDPIYRQVFALRSLHAFQRVVSTWFEVRDIGWPGERRAIRTLEGTDPHFLHLVERRLREPNPVARHAIHEEAANRALEPLGGLLPDGQVDPGQGTWERLLTPPQNLGKQST